jgi:endoglycosylceramidase
MRTTFRAVVTTVVLAALAVPITAGPSAATPPAGTGVAASPLGQTGRWTTDPSGRVVVLHGLNQVYKIAPYAPSADGFGEDDAAFLAANGFNAVRVGVIWAAVEPQPGQYDDAYLASIAATVQTLAAHGIVSLLDFHQDLYNEKFQGEGAPAWAVQDGGLPNPALGFPFNYFGNLAEDRAWDAFWRNAPAADGVGLQDHYARAWAHVAARFADVASVVGYEVLNEPWPGTVWEPCAVPVAGCPIFDRQLTRFYQRVTTAIRTVDPVKTVWIEPNVLFATIDTTYVGTVNDPHVGWAFHDYCALEEELQNNTLCPPLDALTIAAAKQYSTRHQVPWLLTEFGATTDLANLRSMVSLADKNRLGWLEWAYTGHDKTSSSPDGQALVLDPSKPPTGANVLTDKLAVLAEPYPQIVAGTPSAWSYTSRTFRLTYSTARVDGHGRFAAGSQTEVAVPAIQYPNGYHAQVSGAVVASAPNASTLRLLSRVGATAVTVALTPA